MSAVERVSVVPPTKYAGPGLAEEKAPLSIEIVAIDLGSRDDTLATLRTFAVRVHEIAPAGFEHGETRNLDARLDGSVQRSAWESVPFSRTKLGEGARGARRCRA